MRTKLTIYCMSPARLQEQLWSELRIRETEEACKGYLDRFFETYPGVHKYIEDTKAFVARYYFTYTYTGRRRRFMIAAYNRAHAARMGRQAVNARIQTTSSDLVSCNMIDLSRWLKQHGGRLILTVHDSMPFQLPAGMGKSGIKKELDAIIMENTAHRAPWLPVRWKYDVGFGPNYGDTHEEVE